MWSISSRICNSRSYTRLHILHLNFLSSGMRDLCPPVAPLLRSGVECNALTPRANGLSPSSHRMDPSIFLVCSNRRPPSDVADFSVLDAYCLISALITRDFHFIFAEFVQPQQVYQFHLDLLFLSYSCLSLLLEDRFSSPFHRPSNCTASFPNSAAAFSTAILPFIIRLPCNY